MNWGGASRVILKISPHSWRKTVYDSPVAVTVQIYCSLQGPAGRRSIQCCLCFTAPGAMAWQSHARDSSLGIMDGVVVSILWLWTRKLQRKVLILCDMLGKLGYIIRNTDSFAGCLNGWEGHESGWWNVEGRELKFSSCCDQMFSGFQQSNLKRNTAELWKTLWSWPTSSPQTHRRGKFELACGQFLSCYS